MNFELVNRPSNDFYEKMYEEIKRFMESNVYLKDINLKIDNTRGVSSVISENPKYGLVDIFVVDNVFKYNIKNIEIIQLENIDVDVLDMFMDRYYKYFKSLMIPFVPETITLMVMLHEIGHITHYERMNDCIENKKSVMEFDRAMNHLSLSVFRQWDYDYVSNVSINMISDLTEVFAEGFSYRYFSLFKPLIDTFNFKCQGLEVRRLIEKSKKYVID